MLITSTVLSLSAMLIYLITSAVTTRACFGRFESGIGHIMYILAISVLIYTTYTAIQTFASFTTKSVPISMVICILLPIITNTVFSVLGTLAATLPEEILPCFAIFPTFQSILVVNKIAGLSVLLVSIFVDIIWTVGITLLGIVRFRKTDIK